MLARSTLARRCLPVLAVSGVLVMTSCSRDDSFGRRYSVSGTVTYNGKPLEKGVISFIPDDPKGMGATGTIENGSYVMMTGGNNDGARAGKYKVTITAREDASAKAKADFQKARAASKKFAGAEEPVVIPREFLSKAEAAAKNLIPAGYGDVRTTTLAADVKEQSNTIDFELSDASAPPEPQAPPKGRGRKGS